MTTYPTPAPVSAHIDVELGDVWITAEDRADTVVEITPTHPSEEADVRAAERTRVDLIDGQLRISGPRRPTLGPGRKTGSVQVAVTLPTGSHLDVTTALGAIQATGGLGECRAKTSAGDIRVQDAARANLRTSIGVVRAEHITGDAHCTTGSGTVQVARIGGRAEVKNSNGDTRIGAAGSGLRVKAANGSVTVERAQGDLVAATANGNLRVGCAAGGAAHLRTGLGRIDVGILAGSVAHLDLRTSFGTVHNHLDPADQPAPGAASVTVSAVTGAGDIEITRVLPDEA